MMMPYIVESTEKDGKVIDETEPSMLNIVCAKATTDTLVRALKKVTQEKEGTAYKSMQGAKCVVAGKTGTAWIALTGAERIGAKDQYTLADETKRYQGTFAGFFPADDPQYSGIVVVYTDPMNSGREGGGNKPAKVFKNIVNELWAYDSKWREQLSEKGRMPEIADDKIIFGENNEVPDLTGVGLRDALYALENMGYQCEYTGVGHIVKQEVNGKTIKLTLQ
jgi:cell division protein FtsI (penicillin-binding protein 3)